MSIKIGAKDPRGQRHTDVGRDRLKLELKIDPLFRSSTLTTVPFIDYGQIRELGKDVGNVLQTLEDLRVDSENRKIASDVNKELNKKLIDLSIDVNADPATIRKQITAVQDTIKSRYKQKYKDSPSNQWSRLEDSLNVEFEKFRKNTTGLYIDRAIRNIITTNLDSLDADKDEISSATDISNVKQIFEFKMNLYDGKDSPFQILLNAGLPEGDVAVRLDLYKITAVNKIADLLLENVDKGYRTSDAKQYYGQPDYTKLRNFLAKKGNQEKIATELGLDYKTRSVQELFEKAVNILGEQIKKQNLFIAEENKVHNNKITTEAFEYIQKRDWDGLKTFIDEKKKAGLLYRGPDSANNIIKLERLVKEFSEEVSIQSQANYKKIIIEVSKNPDVAYTIFTPVLDNKSALDAFIDGDIDMNHFLDFREFIKADPGLKRRQTQQYNEKTTAYKAARKSIETFYSTIDSYADATWNNIRLELEEVYRKRLGEGIPHTVLINTSFETLHGQEGGEKNSIFYNIVKERKPTQQDSLDRIRLGYVLLTDEDILADPLIQVYMSGDREKKVGGEGIGEYYTDIEWDALLLKKLEEAGITHPAAYLKKIKKAIKRQENKVEE